MSQKKRLLIVDDEPNIRRILQVAFEKSGYQTLLAENAEEALAALDEFGADVVLTDVTMPGMNGYQLLKEIRSRLPATPVVVMTAYGTIPQAIQAIRDGAFEFSTKPFDLEVLKRIVAAAADSVRKSPTKGRPGQVVDEGFVAESPAMREVLETVRQVADSRATVLVTGESGTGKEIVSKLIHRMSPRRDRPFVALSCAALPETLLESELFGYEKGAFTGANGSKQGRFEVAHTGTLFLDEIGDVPPSVQIKLLRVLQERQFERLGSSKAVHVDVRLITATNRDLQEAVAQGQFRLDLLYRLQVVEVHLPPLRQRPEDVLPLARLFLTRFASENGSHLKEIAPDAERVLVAHLWPGNVRELENTMERAVVLSGREETRLLAKHLPPGVRRAA